MSTNVNPEKMDDIIVQEMARERREKMIKGVIAVIVALIIAGAIFYGFVELAGVSL